MYSITKNEAEQIRSFANSVLNKGAHTINDFGRGDLPRDQIDALADLVVGKAAEFIFRAFAYRYGITVGVDLDVYPDQNVTDFGQDIPVVELSHHGYTGWYVNNLKIDIKATTLFSKWLLVEKRKFDSNAYVLIKMDIPKNWESLSLKLDGMSGEVAGFAWWTDIMDTSVQLPWFSFKKGDSLFYADNISPDEFDSADLLHEYLETNPQRRMNMVLRSNENYGLPLNWLRNDDADWQRLFTSLVSVNV